MPRHSQYVIDMLKNYGLSENSFVYGSPCRPVSAIGFPVKDAMVLQSTLDEDEENGGKSYYTYIIHSMPLDHSTVESYELALVSTPEPKSIDIPFAPDFSENMDRTNSHGDHPCIICGRKARQSRYWVHVHGGFTTIVTEQEAERLNATEYVRADMGMFPIGSDCLRKHPELKEYVVIQ